MVQASDGELQQELDRIAIEVRGRWSRMDPGRAEQVTAWVLDCICAMGMSLRDVDAAAVHKGLCERIPHFREPLEVVQMVLRRLALRPGEVNPAEPEMDENTTAVDGPESTTTAEGDGEPPAKKAKPAKTGVELSHEAIRCFVARKVLAQRQGREGMAHQSFVERWTAALPADVSTDDPDAVLRKVSFTGDKGKLLKVLPPLHSDPAKRTAQLLKIQKFWRTDVMEDLVVDAIPRKGETPVEKPAVLLSRHCRSVLRSVGDKDKDGKPIDTAFYTSKFAGLLR
mmetsp:Transcript_58969/g.157647  ORF Transcript_58969/g.157647 Transcript_58969/m.157647 type:complete len:283 (+) Transcript_58969:73-921(+)